MIVAKGTAVIKPQWHAEGLLRVTEFVDRSRQEEGCISIAITSDIFRQDTFFLFSEWRDRECLTQHVHSQIVKDFYLYLSDILAGDFQLKIYEVVASEIW